MRLDDLDHAGKATGRVTLLNELGTICQRSFWKYNVLGSQRVFFKKPYKKSLIRLLKETCVIGDLVRPFLFVRYMDDTTASSVKVCRWSLSVEE
jgi:hypothetical protein